MKEEALRMERVTYTEKGVTLLDNFNFQIFSGEIMGLVPLDSQGLDALIRLLQENQPLLYGYIYLQETLVNTYSQTCPTENNVQVISNVSNLVDYVSVAENVFALRRGYRGLLVRGRILRQQFRLLMEELGMEIPPDAMPPCLTLLERYVTEIVKAMVSSPDLIVLQDPSSVLNPDDLKHLYRVLRHYADRGTAFLYISIHREELSQICDRISLMENGRIVRITESGTLLNVLLKSYEAFALLQGKNSTREKSSLPEQVFSCDNLYFNHIHGLSFSVQRGECLAIHDHGNMICDDLLQILSGEKPEFGSVSWGGTKTGQNRQRETAVILENPADTMLFDTMSYEDNLCLTIDHRVNGLWHRDAARRSIARELLGENLPEPQTPVKELSLKQKYRLVYTRVLLQKPDVVFCIHPYLNVDMELREHVQSLIGALLERGIAVVIIVVNFQDALLLANRLLLVRDGRDQGVLLRSEFENWIIN